LQEIAGLIDTGKLQVIVEKEFSLSEAAAAHELSETGHVRGKIILTMG
jgi:NADPH:quinone reductase-like Zn-dependent oxidoreductase